MARDGTRASIYIKQRRPRRGAKKTAARRPPRVIWRSTSSQGSSEYPLRIARLTEEERAYQVHKRDNGQEEQVRAPDRFGRRRRRSCDFVVVHKNQPPSLFARKLSKLRQITPPLRKPRAEAASVPLISRLRPGKFRARSQYRRSAPLPQRRQNFAARNIGRRNFIIIDENR